jgi:apolipoprotein D and lipocalin family protein
MTDRRASFAIAALAVVGLGAAVVANWAKGIAGPIGNPAVPEPAKGVDIERYLGLWYEIGRYENGFERGLEGVTAEYRARPDGKIQVVNIGRLGGPTGRVKMAEGLAKVVKRSRNAKLKVSFFGPLFFGDYWVLDRADDYGWSIVGEPSGRFLWLLSRTPDMTREFRAAIEGRAKELGYDTDLIRETRQ